MKIKTSINFDFEKAKSKLNKGLKSASTKNLDNVVSQLKSNIENQTYFKDKPIHPITKSVRLVRGITHTKPLISSGRLLRSIKKTKDGVSYNAYGEKQHEGFVFRSGWNKNSKDGFYAPSSKAKSKILYQVRGGTEVEARPWIEYVPSEKDMNVFYKEIMNSISTSMRTITVREI